MIMTVCFSSFAGEKGRLFPTLSNGWQHGMIAMPVFLPTCVMGRVSFFVALAMASGLLQ